MVQKFDLRAWTFLVAILSVALPLICADDSALIGNLNERINNEFGGFFKNKACCSNSNIVGTGINTNNGKPQEVITCSPIGLSKTNGIESCADGSFQEIIIDSSLYSITTTPGNSIEIKNQCDKDEPPIKLGNKDTNFCVGLKLLNDVDESDEPDDEEEDADYDDDEALQLQPDDLACSIVQPKEKKEALQQKYVLVLKHCPLACGKVASLDNPMCIRTCNCPKNFVMDTNGKCQKMLPSIQIEIDDNSKKSMDNQNESRRDIVFELGLKLDTTENFDIVNKLRKQCPEGYRKRYLNPKERCSDLFTIGTAHFNRIWCSNTPKDNPRNADVKLMIHNEHINANLDAFSGTCDFENAEGLSPDNFCLDIDENGEYTAEICEKIPIKYSFYPAILLVSCVFLLITLVVFSLKKKALINNYTMIVWHFVLAMLLAFLVLIINQLTEIKVASEGLCVAVGILQNFFFLLAFIFMTILSIETCWRSRNTFVELRVNILAQATAGLAMISGSDNVDSKRGRRNSKSSDSLLTKGLFYNGNKNFDKQRHYREVACAYIIAFLWTLAAIIANFISYDTLEKCSHGRPRFGENKCFYSDRVNKAIWFYLPIGICLTINFIMFVINGVLIFKYRKDFESFCWTVTRYLVLVIGIGLIWTFEIFSGIFGDDETEWQWYVTDILEMLQGVWIFLAFVVCNPSAREELVKMLGGKQEEDATGGDALLDDTDKR